MTATNGTHGFVARATWTGALAGASELAAPGLRTAVSASDELGGAGRGTNPEELFASAAASCYLMTLAIELQRRALAVRELTVASELAVQRHRGARITALVH